ncbi:hypothetical protein QBC42DRAFT_247128 [Cladorrhinum samala]|uniref:Uncharacterized protein n=1 Tax=Cladorrhinum samala TaxID=585594 RepID=A0AAV9I237_9PEZI|nr:hypothetical protein QBC42DRAFT_247128 [Cladorrhinum samala]
MNQGQQDPTSNQAQKQILRLALETLGPAATRTVQPVLSVIYGSSWILKKLTQTVASWSVGKGIYGAAVASYTSKLMRTNLITAGIELIWEIGTLLSRYYGGEIDLKELMKGILERTVTQTGRVGGWAAAMAVLAQLPVLLPLPIGAPLAFLIGLCASIVGGLMCKRLVRRLMGEESDEEFVEELCRDWEDLVALLQGAKGFISDALEYLAISGWFSKRKGE